MDTGHFFIYLMARSRTWIFTDFELKNDDPEYQWLFAAAGVEWLLVGATEVCPSTGRNHRHGVIHFGNPRRRRGVQVACGGPNCHVEPQRGTAEQARVYACKEGTLFEAGVPRGCSLGMRNDLSTIIDRIAGGDTPSEIDVSNPKVGARYGGWVRRVFADTLRRKQLAFRELSVVVLWGEPGTGKSRQAFADAGDLAYVFPLQRPGNCWFDGYEGQSSLIIDEFEGELPLNHLLKIIDGHRFTGEVKGGHTYPLWTKVWITSNTHPKNWYPDAHEVKVRALLRRINVVSHFESAFNP